MSSLRHFMIFIKIYIGSKDLRECLVEDPPLGSLASPCDPEENASHHDNKKTFIFKKTEIQRYFPEETKKKTEEKQTFDLDTQRWNKLRVACTHQQNEDDFWLTGRQKNTHNLTPPTDTTQAHGQRHTRQADCLSD